MQLALRPILIAGFLASFGGAGAGPLDDWWAAYQRQDYATALQLVRPLADAGLAQAQFDLGYMYAGGHGVPGGENALALGGRRVRYFSVRECGRLQTFPDDFVFHGSWSETMRQLGNAVPVDFAEVVARSVRRQLEGAKSRTGRA